MRWPWQRPKSGDQLVISWSGKTFAFVRSRQRADGLHEVLKFGMERQGADSMEDFVRRLQALGLKGLGAQAMLRPGQYQVLQIDAPAVPPEELRSAARYQIREMIDTHLDDITLDVMRVGDGQQKGAGHLFVVAATNAVVRELRDLTDALQLTLPVVDIQETAQRNLQCALAARDNNADRATAALILLDGQQAVLTISAREELFYTRHFDLPEGFLALSWGHDGNAPAAADDAYSPVDEYVPDYSVGGVSYGNDYSGARAGAATTAVGMENDSAQRLLVEVQRSLDVWDRSWSSMPLQCLRVFAGERSDELAQWLASQLGQTVLPMEVRALFPGFENGAADEQAQCLPLLGVLMRTVGRKL
jgi:MSHA biogenesis protein MshI